VTSLATIEDTLAGSVKVLTWSSRAARRARLAAADLMAAGEVAAAYCWGVGCQYLLC